ncbi:TPA: DUF4055 domain-containing protein [Pseudomonas putida]|uniref:DUF4055 domain-containing protein n=1 Tax=Pseudomonas monteilii TaxID=76759 RepID=UPI00048F2AF2|nr:DUF4055 domain-containing protein [Pseudomonas monteilii]HDS1797588.1 DUF4055 domain-containing protein [Pseudomonas putida]HDS1803569.1 DUF4055 domain-containing protein [Pseudomonas putida]
MSDNPSFTLPAVDEMRRYWAVISPLMGGTLAMRAAGQKLLPRYPAEDEDVYKDRLAQSTLLPAYSETVGNMTSRVFAEPLQVGDDVPPEIAEMTVDIDLAGNDLNNWAVEFFRNGLSHGLCHALVDHPAVQAGRTRAEEKASGVRPYTVLVKPEQVLGWKSNGSVLTHFRYIEMIEEEDGEFGVECVLQIRVLEPGLWWTYRVAKNGGAWAIHDEGVTSLDHIPLVTFYTGRTGFMTAKPPLLELAHLNVKHWQSQSDQDNILHVIRVPILARIGVQPMYDNQGKPVPPEFKVGTGSLTDLPKDGDLKYVEHTGKAVESGRTALQDLLDEMRMAGAKLLTPDKSTTKTATQAEEEAAQELSPLARMAHQFADCLGQLLQYMAEYRGLSDGGSVEMRGNFDVDYMPEVSLPTLVSMANAGMISKETLFAEMQRRGVISDEYDWAEELAKIDSQGPALGAI